MVTIHSLRQTLRARMGLADTLIKILINQFFYPDKCHPDTCLPEHLSYPDTCLPEQKALETCHPGKLVCIYRITTRIQKLFCKSYSEWPVLSVEYNISISSLFDAYHGREWTDMEKVYLCPQANFSD